MKNPNNLEFKKKFDNVSQEFDNISNQYSVKRRAEALQAELTGLILEVGSATGKVTEGYHGTVICSDISFGMCKQAKLKQTNVVCCDAEMLPFKEHVFDAIVAAEVIYYFKNPQKFISDSSKILKKNGQLVISMINPNMIIIDKIRTFLRNLGVGGTYFDDGIKEFINLEKVQSLLLKHKFQIDSINKQVILPFEKFDKLNRFLEKTSFNNFSIFIIIRAST